MLAPTLTAFLNACFVQGRFPACVSSALVTPAHNKGAVADSANCRPIAVGELLYRLYTIILNARLVAWSEEHSLRSLVQAGFRPGHHLSTIWLPCGTSLGEPSCSEGLCLWVCGFAEGY